VRTPVEAAKLPDALVALDVAARELRDELVAAANALAALARDADATLDRGRQLAAAIAAAAKVELGSGSTTGMTSLTTAIQAIRAAVERPLLKLDGNVDAAKSAFVARDYRLCFEKLDPHLEPPQGGQLTIDGPRVGSIPAAASAAVPRVPPAHANPAAALPLFDARVQSRSIWARRGQVALTFLVIPLCAYGAYPSFVGTKLEIFAILAAAFMTDFTFDTAIAALGRAKEA
jgi:hypothetical protein